MEKQGYKMSKNKQKLPKQRLLEAAYELFGQRDPADVSVRELAKKANVNIASINYHFGSKEELYMSLLQNITCYMEEKTAHYMQTIKQKIKNLDSNISPKDLQLFYINLFLDFIGLLAKTIFERLKHDNYIHTILVREQMHPTPAFSLLYEKGLKNIFDFFDKLLAHIDTNSSQETIKLRAHIFFGQIIIFVATYATFNKRLDNPLFSDERIEQIVSLIKQHTRIILQSFI
jgi:AcrR family transcriptional regulator